jgi:hypothetical protein
VIAPVAMTPAALTFFFHVGDFSTRRDLAVLADDASAGESGEAKKPNETAHAILRHVPKQYLYR